MKTCIAVQLICAYILLFASLAAVFIFHETKDFTLLFLLTWIPQILVIAASVLNIVRALSKRAGLMDDAAVQLWLKTVFCMKLLLIPVFAGNLFLGVYSFALGMITGITFLVTLAAAIVSFFMLLSSSIYSAILILHARKAGAVQDSHGIVLAITQFIYVIDIIGFIIFRRLLKKAIISKEAVATE